MAQANSVESRIQREAYVPPPPVDLDHLRRYTLGDRALELEILGLFAEQMPLTIGALKNAPSPKEWAIAAHTLKGSARAVGAWTVASIAESAERLKPESSERDLVVQRLEEAAGEARAYIVSLGGAA
jgi:HPt (histidine-containing phosphotransfer) domain-containing protein